MKTIILCAIVVVGSVPVLGQEPANAKAAAKPAAISAPISNAKDMTKRQTTTAAASQEIQPVSVPKPHKVKKPVLARTTAAQQLADINRAALAKPAKK